MLWIIFESVRVSLREQKLTIKSGMFNVLSRQYLNGAASPLDFVVVDEAQDIDIAQVRLLASNAGGRANGLVFAGDLGQRIFQQRFRLRPQEQMFRGRSTTR